LAEPGFNGLGWLSCGAQPVRYSSWNVVRTRPSGSANCASTRSTGCCQQARRNEAAAAARSCALARPNDFNSCIRFKGAGVAHVQPVGVDHRQGKACALQQAACFAHIGKRGHAGRGAAGQPGLCLQARPGAVHPGCRRPAWTQAARRPAFSAWRSRLSVPGRSLTHSRLALTIRQSKLSGSSRGSSRVKPAAGDDGYGR
jgi:hypothetical protein